MRFQVLGAVRAWRVGAELDLGPPQQRAVAAALVLRAGTSVTAERLIDDVWGEEPPRTAAFALRNYIYRLRRAAAGSGRTFIESGNSGYGLVSDEVRLDLTFFESCVVRARAVRGDNSEYAYSLYTDAMALWNGDALQGVPGPYAAAQRTRLGELRLAAFEEYIDCAIRLGRHDQALSELPGMVLENPFDERLRELHMLALHRAGRQADALAVYRETRRILDEELGTEPGAGLREAHRRVLAADPTPPTARARPTKPTVWPAQLPPALEHFVGRGREMGLLLGEGPGGSGFPAPAPVSVVHGMAGVGKTALAVRAAHALAPGFQDGQLHIDLHGFDPHGDPTDPAEALADLLVSMDVRQAALPASLPARSALFRSMLAGRRMLLLLDNARDAEQVRPLLPAGRGCVALVTSRCAMPGLVAGHGARSVPLAGFTASDSARFLASALGACRAAQASSAAAALIIEHCAGLPLALAAVAARLATDPWASLDEIAGVLAAAAGSLDEFVIHGDAAFDLRAAFHGSYRVLGDRAARLFRLLAARSDGELTAADAAILAAVPVREARDLLSELSSVHLATVHADGRYAINDLLRIYGAELAAPPE